MALNSSGPISLAGSTAGQSIALEIGQGATAQISLNDTAVRSLAGVSSGVIVMPTNFYGKSTNYNFSPTISTSVTDYNLRAAAVTAGWDQVTILAATITISSTGVIGSSSTSTAGLIWTGSYPTGSTLAVINNGYIVGRGGNGGSGGAGGNSAPIPPQPGSAGSPGGPAMQGNYAISFTNNTTIGGGGNGGTGSDGSSSGGGNGGVGGAGYIAGTGGGGGGAGTSGGSAGSNGANGTLTTGGALGGGNCTVSGTNAYITWVTTGTRLGTLG